MARIVSTVCRLCRRSGDKLFLKGDRCFGAKCGVDRRPKAPGPHAATRRRLSDRAVQLREKQKAKYSYGLLEKQFKRFFAQAENQPGITGSNLMVLLERRLDNVVYKLGFADSHRQARQIVLHGHILVNDHKVNVPSYLINAGDNIKFREGSKKTEYFKILVEGIKAKSVPNWLSLDRAGVTGQVVALPTPDVLEVKFEPTSVVEWYSR